MKNPSVFADGFFIVLRPGLFERSSYVSAVNGEATSRRRGKRYPVPGAKLNFQHKSHRFEWLF